MPINNFKLFDEKKANMMTDDDYAINQQRLNGVQSGVASSQLQNKTLYQTALMCYALAQLMAANGYDANDANAVSTFVNNMSQTMVQKVVDKATDEDISSGNDNKWVSAKNLSEKTNNLYQIIIYDGDGQIYNGYVKTLNFVKKPKVIIFVISNKDDEIESYWSSQGGLIKQTEIITENIKSLKLNLTDPQGEYFNALNRVSFNENGSVTFTLDTYGKTVHPTRYENESVVFNSKNKRYTVLGLFG